MLDFIGAGFSFLVSLNPYAQIVLSVVLVCLFLMFFVFND